MLGTQKRGHHTPTRLTLRLSTKNTQVPLLVGCCKKKSQTKRTTQGYTLQNFQISRSQEIHSTATPTQTSRPSENHKTCNLIRNQILTFSEFTTISESKIRNTKQGRTRCHIWNHFNESRLRIPSSFRRWNTTPSNPNTHLLVLTTTESLKFKTQWICWFLMIHWPWGS